MILVDSRPLELDALNDPKHKLYDFAREYDDTLKELRSTYKNGFIRFKRVGYPRHVKGADSNFNEIPKMAEPIPILRIPLKAYATTGKLGKHLWACCMDTPTILPNGLWDMGTKKAMSIKEGVLININEEPDLAFYFYKICPFVKRGMIKVVDPAKDDADLGAEEMELTERKYAVWNMLGDVEKLKTMARAYGVTGVETKQPNAIRKELEELLLRNDKAKKQNPAVKGTKEFIEEMKVTDSVLLRAFVQRMMDEKRLEYRADGRFRVGEKIIIQVPVSEINRNKEYLCQYLMTGNNAEKLQEFLKDLISKTYIEAITEKKELEWLVKISGENPAFKKTEDLREKVLNYFTPV
jgi:hypothetical protein